MSKNVIIQQNGVAETLTVDTLRLKNQSGGTEDWVPADGKNLVELQIGGSGTYKASDYNAYGIAVARVKPKYGGGATYKAAEHDFTKKHTPSIKEGGKSRNFSAAMLKTNLQGGGTCLWIPRMDVELKNKYISKSGTYTAKADNCFGFDQITVSGVDVEITQDEDGDDVERTTDGGEVTETKLPSYIRVTALPQKIDYADGETIDFSGMVVKAYLKTGGLWTDSAHPNGIIPISELMLPVTIADASQASKSASSSLNTGSIIQPIEVASHGVYQYDEVDRRIYDISDGCFILDFDNSGACPVFASKSADAVITRTEVYGDGSYDTITYGLNNSYTYNGKTVHYRLSGYAFFGVTYKDNSYPKFNKTRESAASDVDIIHACWTMIWGEISEGEQNIPVQWLRAGDSSQLESSFDITVT